MRVAALLLLLAIVGANALRPVRAISPKRNAGSGLVLRVQDVARGTSDSLDPDILNDLPRIRPDARGMFGLSRDPGNGRLVARGTIVDPYTGKTGIAVFPIVDERRIANARTRLAGSAFRIVLPSGARACCTSVGLVASDERGYFRLDRAR